MVLKRINVEKKLSHYRDSALSSETILAQVSAILEGDRLQSERIALALSEGKSHVKNTFDIDLLDTDKIYHLEHIKTICIRYRLRFLEAKYFKGGYPQQAISCIKTLEKQHGISIKGFKIVAPSKLFRLEKADDPLLFVPIGNGYYYLVHKWGRDLHPLRKWLMLPFKSFLNLLIFIALISGLLTGVMPPHLFSRTSNVAYFWVLYLFVFKMIAGIILFYGFALGKNFNYAIWNSTFSKARF